MDDSKVKLNIVSLGPDNEEQPQKYKLYIIGLDRKPRHIADFVDEQSANIFTELLLKRFNE